MSGALVQLKQLVLLLERTFATLQPTPNQHVLLVPAQPFAKQMPMVDANGVLAQQRPLVKLTHLPESAVVKAGQPRVLTEFCLVV